jgi:hypothetical protein
MAMNAADPFPLLVLADKYVADDIECMIDFAMALPNEMVLDMECAKGWSMVAAKLVKSDDILADLLEFCSADTKGLRMHMCDRCLWKVSRGAKEERKEIWAKLPDYFEVCLNERAYPYLDTFCAAESEFVLM